MSPDSDTIRAKRDKALKLAKQDQCQHEDVYSSSVRGPDGTFYSMFCWDCLKVWRS